MGLDLAAPAAPKRILLVDDSPAVRSAFRAILEREGWTVLAEASNGRDAIQKAALLFPDLIILDISMPLMNGLDAAREIRKSVKGIPVLFVSQYDLKEYLDEAIEIGAQGYVLKSDGAVTLISAVRAALSGVSFFHGVARQLT
jgi:two-component system, NarL family, nitrate/nitrite response regulator NarL